MTHFMIPALINLLCISIIAQYFWSTRKHFEMGRKTREFQLLFLLVGFSALANTVLLWSHPKPASALFAGLALILIADALFWFAIQSSRQARLKFIFDESRPDAILKHGIYAHIRHPFYTSYILFWSGWAIAAWHWLPAISAIIFVAVYWRAARAEESVFLNGPLKDNYQQYQREAGLFWPRMR